MQRQSRSAMFSAAVAAVLCLSSQSAMAQTPVETYETAPFGEQVGPGYSDLIDSPDAFAPIETGSAFSTRIPESNQSRPQVTAGLPTSMLALQEPGSESQQTPPKTQNRDSTDKKPVTPQSTRPATPRSTPPAGQLPPATTPRPPAPPRTSIQRRSPFASALQRPGSRRPLLARLTRTPDMFGDSITPLSASIDTGNRLAVVDLPSAGGGRIFRNEHSRALPTDRVFAFYHHFHNAVELNRLPGQAGPTRSVSVNRYTVGFEKTFDDGLASLEVRLPISEPIGLTSPELTFGGDGLGNLTLILKRMLYADDSAVLAAGLALSAPTGSDVTGAVGFGGNTFRVQNSTYHLSPYLGIQTAADETLFFNGFVQVNTPLNYDTIAITTPVITAGPTTTERIEVSTQTMMFVDASLGYWIYRGDESSFLTGLAPIAEAHYTTTLERADFASDSNRGFVAGNADNRLDIVNLTAGFHAEFAHSTSLRAALSFPVKRNERLFDSELTIALIHRR